MPALYCYKKANSPSASNLNFPSFDDGILAAKILRRTTTPVYGQEAKKLIRGKTIIITGAGGSIGSEIAFQIKRIDPKAKTYFIDNDEYALYKLQLKLTGQPLLCSSEYILANITDRPKMRKLFKEIRPDIVFHAAAHKHLPLLERFPEAAIRTNILGTQIVAETCALTKVKCFVNISTDKAARPISILGLTKRIAEMTAASYANTHTKVASVRFGNVFGSRGSFLETLKYQVANKLPITITDPAMTRYFMTIPEAAGLVIEAAVLADRGKTFVLDMGKPILIREIVNRFLKLTKSANHPIIYTGSRTGEKLREELFDPSEVSKKTSHKRIFSVDVSNVKISKRTLTNLFALSKSCAPMVKLRTRLEQIVASNEQPEYQKFTSFLTRPIYKPLERQYSLIRNLWKFSFTHARYN